MPTPTPTPKTSSSNLEILNDQIPSSPVVAERTAEEIRAIWKAEVADREVGNISFFGSTAARKTPPQKIIDPAFEKFQEEWKEETTKSKETIGYSFLGSRKVFGSESQPTAESEEIAETNNDVVVESQAKTAEVVLAAAEEAHEPSSWLSSFRPW